MPNPPIRLYEDAPTLTEDSHGNPVACYRETLLRQPPPLNMKRLALDGAGLVIALIIWWALTICAWALWGTP